MKLMKIIPIVAIAIFALQGNFAQANPYLRNQIKSLANQIIYEVDNVRSQRSLQEAKNKLESALADLRYDDDHGGVYNRCENNQGWSYAAGTVIASRHAGDLRSCQLFCSRMLPRNRSDLAYQFHEGNCSCHINSGVGVCKPGICSAGRTAGSCTSN